jgi:hypothetical protein
MALPFSILEKSLFVKVLEIEEEHLDELAEGVSSRRGIAQGPEFYPAPKQPLGNVFARESEGPGDCMDIFLTHVTLPVIYQVCFQPEWQEICRSNEKTSRCI